MEIEIVNLNEVHLDGKLVGSIAGAFLVCSKTEESGDDLELQAALDSFIVAGLAVKDEIIAKVEVQMQVEETRYIERLAARKAEFDALQASTTATITGQQEQLVQLVTANKKLQGAIHLATGAVPELGGLVLNVLDSIETAVVTSVPQVVQHVIQQYRQQLQG